MDLGTTELCILVCWFSQLLLVAALTIILALSDSKKTGKKAFLRTEDKDSPIRPAFNFNLESQGKRSCHSGPNSTAAPVSSTSSDLSCHEKAVH